MGKPGPWGRGPRGGGWIWVSGKHRHTGLGPGSAPRARVTCDQQSSKRLPPRHAGVPAAPNRAEEDLLSLGWSASRLLEGLQPGELASHGGTHHLLQLHG